MTLVLDGVPRGHVWVPGTALQHLPLHSKGKACGMAGSF